jgi:RNA-directed DNA polymerase
MTHEQPPSEVPGEGAARQDGDIWDRWSWASRAAWTSRMLAALENGVRGGVWFTLIDKTWSPKTLFESATKVLDNKGAAGVDHVGVEEFERDLHPNLERLSSELRAGTYRPQSVRRVLIPKAGSRETRPLGIPTVRDRVAQGAVRLVIEPIFERTFAEHSYGFRPGRGCKDALRRVEQLLDEGHVHVVDADLKSYFDSIPHDLLMKQVRTRVADGRVLELIESYLKAGIFDGLTEWTPESGAPQGAVLSPLLSNIYLNPLDHLMVSGGWEMVRYADDFVIMCRSAEDAERALAAVREWTAAAGLTLHPTKTRVVDVRTGSFDFLGYTFQAVKDGSVRHWPRKKSLRKLKDSIRTLTRRTNGHSIERVIDDLNPVLRGWLEYFKHSYRYTMDPLDKWIRQRLRSILRKRMGKHGRSRCRDDHQRWPNAYFNGLGLLNLTAAQRRARQPCLR